MIFKQLDRQNGLHWLYAKFKIIYTGRMKIKLKIVREGAIMPSYQTPGAACVDLHASIDAPIILQPGGYRAVPTGVAAEIPEGHELQVRARSGWAAKNGIGLVNGIGTIDADYRGEIAAILINWGSEPFTINPGERIAQMMLNKIEKIEWKVVDNLSDTERGEGRFGSTLR